jgi:hypothetical protein
VNIIGVVLGAVLACALVCLVPVALVGGLGALGMALDGVLSRRMGTGPLLVGAAPSPAWAARSPGFAAARQRDLRALDRDLTGQDWLLGFHLLRDGVSTDGVYHLLRLRRACQGRRSRHAARLPITAAPTPLP